MAKNDKLAIADFIVSNLKKGDGRGKVLAKVVAKWQISNRTFDRIWKVANQKHIEAQKIINNALAEVDKQAAIEARKKEILSIEERKEILSQIALGGLPLRKAMVVGGEIKEIDVVPDWMDRKNAIAELNKMDGSYAPTKVAATTKDGEDVPINPVININCIRTNIPIVESSNDE